MIPNLPYLRLLCLPLALIQRHDHPNRSAAQNMNHLCLLPSLRRPSMGKELPSFLEAGTRRQVSMEKMGQTSLRGPSLWRAIPIARPQHLMMVLGHRLPSQPRTALTPPVSRYQARSNVLGHPPRKAPMTLLRNLLPPPRIPARHHPPIPPSLEDGLNITPTPPPHRLAPDH